MLRVRSIDDLLSHAARKSRSKPGILGASRLLYRSTLAAQMALGRRIVRESAPWETAEQGERCQATGGTPGDGEQMEWSATPSPRMNFFPGYPPGERPASHTLCARPRSEKRSATSKCAGPMHPLSPTPRYTRTFGAVARMCTPPRARPPSQPRTRALHACCVRCCASGLGSACGHAENGAEPGRSSDA